MGIEEIGTLALKAIAAIGVLFFLAPIMVYVYSRMFWEAKRTVENSNKKDHP